MREIIQANMIIAFSNYHWSQMDALTNVQQRQGVRVSGWVLGSKARQDEFSHDSGAASFQQVVSDGGQILNTGRKKSSETNGRVGPLVEQLKSNSVTPGGCSAFISLFTTRHRGTD